MEDKEAPNKKPGPFDLDYVDPIHKIRRKTPSNYLELLEYEFEHNISERSREYEERPYNLLSQEIPAEQYLRTLKKDEREGIWTIIDTTFTIGKLEKAGPLMCLAVGTTTFPNSYWTELEKYLKNNDPSKLDYVKRRGEDIDILLIGEYKLGSETIDSMNTLVEKSLSKKGIQFKKETGRDNGTAYLNVPESEIDNLKEKVLRMKRKEYDGTNFIIDLPNTRSYHLSIRDPYCCGDSELKRERVLGNPFSLLFRRTRYSLRTTINQIEMQPELFD